MVRELEDAPRESIAVVLDVDAGRSPGPPGDSSLDDAVRAAAGLVRAHAAAVAARAARRRGAGAGASSASGASGRDWELALDALAAVEPAHGTALRDARRAAERGRQPCRSSSS